MPMRTARA